MPYASLADLPVELIEKIIEPIDKTPSALLAIALTCRHTANVLLPGYVPRSGIACGIGPEDIGMWRRLAAASREAAYIYTLRLVDRSRSDPSNLHFPPLPVTQNEEQYSDENEVYSSALSKLINLQHVEVVNRSTELPPALFPIIIHTLSLDLTHLTLDLPPYVFNKLNLFNIGNMSKLVHLQLSSTENSYATVASCPEGWGATLARCRQLEFIWLNGLNSIYINDILSNTWPKLRTLCVQHSSIAKENLGFVKRHPLLEHLLLSNNETMDIPSGLRTYSFNVSSSEKSTRALLDSMPGLSFIATLYMENDIEEWRALQRDTDLRAIRIFVRFGHDLAGTKLRAVTEQISLPNIERLRLSCTSHETVEQRLEALQVFPNLTHLVFEHYEGRERSATIASRIVGALPKLRFLNTRGGPDFPSHFPVSPYREWFEINRKEDGSVLFEAPRPLRGDYMEEELWPKAYGA